MSSSSRIAVAVVATMTAAGMLVVPAPAHADKAAADAAFDEGKRLIAAGNVAEACPKFELSYKEDRQLGALLNLADCHERLGRLATAWAEFREASELARRRGDDRESFARQRSEKLEPRIARIELVRRDGAPTTAVTVTLDGRDVTALIGIATPVDPGEHVITTRIDDGPTSTKTVRVTRDGQRLRVRVPIDAPSRTVDDAADDTPPTSSGRAGKRIGLITGAIGLGVAGVGLYFGKRAFDQYDDGRAMCSPDNRCSAQGAALIDDARSSALVSNVLVGVGAGAVITGLVLWLTAPSGEPSSPVSARAVVTPQHAGAALHVQF